MKYKIADLIVEYETKYDMLKARSEKYKVDGNCESDIQIVVDEKYVQEDLKKYPDATVKSVEYVITGSMFYHNLLKYNGCLLHASCVVIDEEAYLFSAPSGTGKSTHTGLWLKYLAEKKPYILNDDKPAMRIFEDGIYAYGTPFSGKHDMSENKKVKVKGICFIEQAKTNAIKKLKSSEAIPLFLEQSTYRLNEENMLRFLNILDIIIRNVPIYKLYCDMSQEAVQLSYETMRGEETNED